jgi:hypothetical protein
MFNIFRKKENGLREEAQSDYLFALGDRVKDRITGFEGIVVSRIDSLQGCNRYAVQPETLEGGKMLEAYYIDEQGLELTAKNVHTPFKRSPEYATASRPGPAPTRVSRTSTRNI